MPRENRFSVFCHQIWCNHAIVIKQMPSCNVPWCSLQMRTTSISYYLQHKLYYQYNSLADHTIHARDITLNFYESYKSVEFQTLRDRVSYFQNNGAMSLVLCREEEGSESNAGNRYRRQLRRGYPPLTPNACAKDAVVSQLFDQAWGEVSWQKLFHLKFHSRIEGIICYR